MILVSTTFITRGYVVIQTLVELLDNAGPGKMGVMHCKRYGWQIAMLGVKIPDNVSLFKSSSVVFRKTCVPYNGHMLTDKTIVVVVCRSICHKNIKTNNLNSSHHSPLIFVQSPCCYVAPLCVLKKNCTEFPPWCLLPLLY